MRSRRFGWFCGLAAALALLRTLILLQHQSTAIGFGGDLPEALNSGRLAFDVLNGSWRGWPVYLEDVGGHLGNKIVASVLALPLFALFGSSLLTMSLIPTGAAVLTAVLISSLASSPGAARWGVLYFVLAPVTVHAWATYPYFSHMESSLFLLAALWLLRPVLNDETRSSADRWRPLAAGIVSGAGIFMSDIQLLGFVTIVSVWVLSRLRGARARGLATYCVGVLAGLVPYALFLSYKPYALSDFYFRSLTSNQAENATYVGQAEQFDPIFWPAGNFVRSEWAQALVGMAGLLALLWYALKLIRSSHQNLVELALAGFVLALGAVGILSGALKPHYVYAVLAPVSLLAGNALSRLDVRARPVTYAILGVAGTLSLMPLMSSLEVGRLGEQWDRIRVARGYAFYFPAGYRSYSGYKTPLDLDVERHASEVHFSDQTDAAAPATKAIFLNPVTEHYLPIRQSADYYLFGVDVTYLGLEAVSTQILQQVPESNWNTAFEGAAVFAANDLLLDDFMQLFEDGAIDSSVPALHARYFYSELGRKLRDAGAYDRPSVQRLLASFSLEKQAWVKAGFTTAQYVDYGIAVWPGDYKGR